MWNGVICYFSSLVHHYVDYIIVGQGLAGSAIAIRLLNRGKKILVIDRAHGNTSSRIAAGLFNPITGRKMVKSWMADKLFPFLHIHYKEAEALTGNTFFYPMPVYRPFISVEEQNEWMAKSAAPEFVSYIDQVYTGQTVAGVSDRFGGLMLKQCGYLNTSAYVDSVKTILNRGDNYAEDDISDSNLHIDDEFVSYGRVRAQNVVFCNGAHQNPWFNWLPVKPLKGETIMVDVDLDPSMIVNRGVYVVPAAGGRWRVGATYNYTDNTTVVTTSSRLELEEKFAELITRPYTVKGQECGFRPTTPDRRPLLGRHPEIKRVWIFNGMGTKGVSLAPYFAELLIRSIENGEALNKDVDIERYKSLYWTSPR